MELVRLMAQEASTEGMVAGVSCKRKKKNVYKEERKELAVVVLPLVRIWVRREAKLPSVGGGEEKQHGERTKREKCWLEKNRGVS